MVTAKAQLKADLRQKPHQDTMSSATHPPADLWMLKQQIKRLLKAFERRGNMANGTEHIAAGALTGTAMALYGQHKGEPVNPVLAIGASTVFSKLPDWIEPATTPHHRQFFHSVCFFTILGYGLKKLYEWKPEDKSGQILRFLTLCAGAGYVSHLVLDGLTPRSLPLLGKLKG